MEPTKRHEPESEDGSHYVCGRCGEHLTDEQIGESQDEALTPCEPRPVAWRRPGDDRAAILERYRGELQELLLRRFAGRHLASGAGPRAEGTFTAAEVREAVERWMRHGDKGMPPGHVRTSYTAAQARAEGRAVPAEVPDHAVLEFEGVRADIDPAAPARVNITPLQQRWVWIEATPPGAA